LGPLVQQLERLLVGGRLAVHPRQQPVEREGAQLADGQPEGLGALADGGVAELPLRAAV
jgi:hypothetical protein